jgi:hypothetical protein
VSVRDSTRSYPWSTTPRTRLCSRVRFERTPIRAALDIPVHDPLACEPSRSRLRRATFVRHQIATLDVASAASRAPQSRTWPGRRVRQRCLPGGMLVSNSCRGAGAPCSVINSATVAPPVAARVSPVCLRSWRVRSVRPAAGPCQCPCERDGADGGPHHHDRTAGRPIQGQRTVHLSKGAQRA